jgi:hypothetical protein
MNAALLKATGPLEQLRKLAAGLASPDLPSPEAVAGAIAEHSAAVDAVLELPVIKVEPYPDVPHHAVMERLQARKAPFKPGGKYKEVGYRDFLIWRNVTDVLARAPGRVGFVFKNRADFGGPKGGVHPELAADLPAGIDPARLSVFTSMHELYEQLVKPELSRLEAVEVVLRERPWQRLVVDYVSTNADLTIDYALESGLSNLPRRLDQVAIMQVEVRSPVEVKSARRLEDERIVVEVHLLAELHLDVIVSEESEALVHDQFVLVTELERFEGEVNLWVIADAELDAELVVREQDLDIEGVAVSRVEF